MVHRFAWACGWCRTTGAILESEEVAGGGYSEAETPKQMDTPKDKVGGWVYVTSMLPPTPIMPFPDLCMYIFSLWSFNALLSFVHSVSSPKS